MAEFDTLALLEDIRERGSLPASDFRFSDALLLKASTRELRECVAPLMQQAKSEHLVYEYTTPLVSGQSTYRIPERALGGGGLRDVVYVNSGGDLVSLIELSAADVARQLNPANTGTPYGYFVRNASVVLVPTPNVTGSLSMPYYARPNALALPSACTAIDSFTVLPDGTSEALVTTDPTETYTTGLKVDMVRATPGFETLALGLMVLETELISAGLWAVRFDNVGTTPAAATAGDFLCTAGTSPVAQVPPELLGLLAVRTVRRCLKAVGDARWQDFNEEAQELEARAVQWLSPRNDGEPRSAPGVLTTGLLAGIVSRY